MKHRMLLIALLFWLTKGHACAISPLYQITTEPDKYVKKSNLVFLGRLIELDNSVDGIQIADFEIIELFKGNLNANIASSIRLKQTAPERLVRLVHITMYMETCRMQTLKSP